MYPAVSLKDARERRDEARKQLEGGADPGEARKAQKATGSLNAANSFEVITRKWHAKFLPTWTVGHADKIMRRFERDVFPWLGSRPVAEIDAPALLAVLRRIESRGAIETAHRAMQSAGQVFRYAIATGRAQRNPAADLVGW
ncbi:integrase arm-type DNA-binding domain-containing protein [Laribacter hongkongensis]|nr:integrase arm-type DNA-binding domain-containing protein [Laribacter hongkongensis]MCG9116963.1 integrase arm-type DNA-binding domain-containing protein [Laribacter hongkongensis]MCG9125884.1 integrase arm-type DNA-binding domain-containing protein [Laribacter hongkongensis]